MCDQFSGFGITLPCKGDGVRSRHSVKHRDIRVDK